MTRTTTVTNANGGGAEKRQWPRYCIDAPIRANICLQGKLKVIHGRANNLSQAGMAVQLPVELVIGESIEVILVLPYCSETLNIRAVVRNRRSYCYGVEFPSLTAAQRTAIERACHSLALLQ
jgi:predicted nucleic acid-binding Zn finger protein